MWSLEWVSAVVSASRSVWGWISTRRSAPAIQIDQIRQSPLFEGTGQPIYWITQIWFTNQPAKPKESSVAKEVTTRLDFFDFDFPDPRLTVHGQWALATAPDHAGHIGTAPAIDIPPGLLPVKLMTLLKYPENAAAYAYAAENLLRYPDGRHPDFELAAGTYTLRVTLMGQNVNQEFWFDVESSGVGTQPTVARTTFHGTVRS